ncbi:discoidin domain-containing protein [Mucilaginibacter sp. KACC 22063]|uniref:discoidin domain-containing protein n=1 Tax=Mucilaginibacter sp. KACC 22063 TaxID=3025666 RepID=UPI0023654379|nr:discoidin domain-containing protein [Mucilaginibacter sp. KACC 22063]WDF57453.1 discoidin domain-containing protein [Mucilaginibacter sp. KACC 22063]
MDLGNTEKLTGFKYLPKQGTDAGLINRYQFYVSRDNHDWKLVSEGEFSNIQNNPVWQTKKFPREQARFIKLRALGNTKNNDSAGYAEIDVITSQ